MSPVSYVRHPYPSGGLALGQKLNRPCSQRLGAAPTRYKAPDPLLAFVEAL